MIDDRGLSTGLIALATLSTSNCRLYTNRMYRVVVLVTTCDYSCGGRMQDCLTRGPRA